MPVTIYPADHNASPLNPQQWRHTDVASCESLLARTLADCSCVCRCISRTHIYHNDNSVSYDEYDGTSMSSSPSSFSLSPSSSCLNNSRPKALLHTSFPRRMRNFEAFGRMFASKHGFLHAVLDACNDHHHLVIRPEDVWFAVLAQLGIYLNVRRAHSSRKKAEQSEECNPYVFRLDSKLPYENSRNMPGTGSSSNNSSSSSSYNQYSNSLPRTGSSNTSDCEIAIAMAKLLDERIRDGYFSGSVAASAQEVAEVRAWIMPAFSTTDRSDQTVAICLMLGNYTRYCHSSYTWGWSSNTRCGLHPSSSSISSDDEYDNNTNFWGIPSVTLEGEIGDWADIHSRVCRIVKLFSLSFNSDFGLNENQVMQAQEQHSELASFQDALLPIVEGLVRCFVNPVGWGEIFWRDVCARDDHSDNNAVHMYTDGSKKVVIDNSYAGWITHFAFWDEDGKCLHTHMGRVSSQEASMSSIQIAVAGQKQRRIERANLPSGFVRLSITLQSCNDEVVSAEMCAGTLAIRANGEAGTIDRKKLNTLAPQAGWFLYRV